MSPHSEQPSKVGMPLITPFALQSVQLRPAKRPENNEVSQLARPQTPEKPQKPGNPTVPQVSSIPSNLRPSSPEKKLSIQHSQDSHIETQPDCDVKSHSEPTSCLTNGSIDLGKFKATAEVDGLDTALSSPAEAPQNTTPKKKPPLVSKKPTFSLTFSSVDHVSDLLSAQNDVCISTSTPEGLDPTPVPEQEETTEKDSIGISAPSEEIRDISPTNCEAQESSQTSGTIILDADMGTIEAKNEEEGDDDDDDVTSSTGSFGSKDDESGELDFPNFTLWRSFIKLGDTKSYNFKYSGLFKESEALLDDICDLKL